MTDVDRWVEILFGEHTILTASQWAKLPSGAGWYYVVAEQKAVMAMPTKGSSRALKIRDAQVRVNLDPDLQFNGKPVYLLTEATANLASADAALKRARSNVERSALELSRTYGKTYYVSRSIAGHLMDGDHYFSVGKSAPCRMSWDGGAMTLDGKKLTWTKSDPQHAQLKGKNVFVHLRMGERYCSTLDRC